MLTIPKDMIGALIGPGGKVIQEIQRVTGATIIVEEIDGHGDVNIFGENAEVISAALDWVKIIVIDPKTGKIKLSRKELLPRPPRQENEKRNPEQNQNN